MSDRSPQHVLESFKVKGGGGTFASQLTWHSKLKFRWHRNVCDDQLIGWLQRPAGDQVYRARIARVNYAGFTCRGFLPPMRATGERPEFDIKSPLGVSLMIFPRGYLLMSFPQGDTSARQRWSWIRVFPLLGELPNYIEPHLPICQLKRWQLGPTMSSSPMAKSLDPIVVTALRVSFSGECLGAATGGFACNCPVPEAWKTEASGQCTFNSASTYIADCVLSYSIPTPSHVNDELAPITTVLNNFW